ncbi:MAG: MotA/TolQ/ExbB proton channel family protein [Gemmatimonadota bacterium]|nr:MotA/TolQ/ExbB proton channel family protein [Gemmatimonadota bacterium]
MMWPLLLITLGILIQAWRAGAALFGRDETSPAVERRTGSILFWGFMAMLLGLVGTFVGIALIASHVSAAGAVSAPVAWGGIGVSLIPTLFGLIILFLAALLWYVLRGRFRRIAAAA